ncbi:GH3 auxin-responsive promoter family protein [Pseudobacteroides cellulosolvens]|uniref:GH3 auxin-responsive promoter n=1 Tax=Pseudobacteroides cellulosolvens ATCC 35603 = DSM 2933 TaxID=398512 RepID=A0A0L6JK61_9FIRM|nr:GH3 auxin-responsive promoter family protein [Pseudobacteroides cellulosolvens]KNY26150.1 GH3 auxin-responsive promoter [Pseudobacteroides cellulosolvens ATCC 35603 = DSM 2933]
MKLLSKVMLYTFSKVAKRYKNAFEKDLEYADQRNNQLLMDIIRKNIGTVYGKKYGFQSIDSPQKFKDSVPLTVYDDYKCYIERMAEGKDNILTSEKVEYFGTSSGTTGSQKLIPTTESSRKSISAYMGLLTQGVLCENLSKSWSYGRGLNLMNMTVSGKTQGGITISAGTAGGMRSMEKMIPYIWTSPVEILKHDGKADINYIHLLFALMEKDLMYIGAPFISSVLDLLRCLENKWPDLVKDIELGTINSRIELDEELRNKLQKKIRPNPKRASELKKEFTSGIEHIVTRIWPKFAFIWSVAGAGFKVYHEKVKKYISDIPVYNGAYAATEGLIGIELELGKAIYVAAPNSVYYEFIRIDESDNQKIPTYSIDELKVGEKYEVVITNRAGFYRYRLGDVVKVTGYRGKSPELEFLYRKNQLINIYSEKTSEQAIHQAIVETFKDLRVELVDYTVMADINVSPGRYVFFVEVNDADSLDKLEVEKILESKLCIANPRYDHFRKVMKISHASLELLKPQTFNSFKNLLLSNGASRNQVKIPRVVSKDYLVEFLKSNTYKKSEELCTL